ncbi:hypothetical protein AgCh_020498 [Apium graveolens]
MDHLAVEGEKDYIIKDENTEVEDVGDDGVGDDNEEEGSAKEEGINSTTEAVVEPTAKKSDTKMSNKVVQPMSRGKYSETTTVTSSGNVVTTTEVITKGMVVNCLLCPVNTAIGCCCPSRAQVAFPAFHDNFSMFD